MFDIASGLGTTTILIVYYLWNVWFRRQLRPSRMILFAAIDGRTTTIKVLLLMGVDTNAKDMDGRTPLHLAAAKGHTVVVKMLLDAGAECDAKDEDGWTPLYDAADKGYTAAVEALLLAGANTDLQDKSGRTPLHLAAAKGHTAVVAELLLKAEAKIDVKDEHGQCPLHEAVDKGHATASKILLAAGADPNTTDSVGRTPSPPGGRPSGARHPAQCRGPGGREKYGRTNPTARCGWSCLWRPGSTPGTACRRCRFGSEGQEWRTDPSAQGGMLWRPGGDRVAAQGRCESEREGR